MRSADSAIGWRSKTKGDRGWIGNSGELARPTAVAPTLLFDLPEDLYPRGKLELRVVLSRPALSQAVVSASGKRHLPAEKFETEPISCRQYWINGMASVPEIDHEFAIRVACGATHSVSAGKHSKASRFGRNRPSRIVESGCMSHCPRMSHFREFFCR